MIGKNKILFIIILCFAIPAFGQTKIQVVTRTITKTFDYRPGSILDIKAEKANVNVKASANGEIKIKLLLIAKNPSKEEAEADLKFCGYQFGESSNTISVSNFFDLKNNYKEISSNLSAKYEIEAPSGIILKLKNIYGETQITGVDAVIKLNSGFGQIKISNVSGNLDISSNYSDITVEAIKAITTIDAQNADISLKGIYNPVVIKNHYGIISLEQIFANTSIKSEMSEINVLVENLQKFNFDCSVKDGEIVVPDELKKFIINKSGDKRLISSNGVIKISISTSYNSITIKTK